MGRQDPADDVLVNVDAEGFRDLLVDSSIAKSTIGPLQFEDELDQLCLGTFQPRRCLGLGGEPILGVPALAHQAE